jgi:hypothetical protein
LTSQGSLSLSKAKRAAITDTAILKSFLLARLFVNLTINGTVGRRTIDTTSQQVSLQTVILGLELLRAVLELSGSIVFISGVNSSKLSKARLGGADMEQNGAG